MGIGMLVFVIVLILLIVLSMGTPVAFGLGFVAVLCTVIFLSPDQLYPIGTIAFSMATSQTMLIAPLFILMAEILAKGGIATDIFTVLSKWMSRLKGGLAVSATMACTIFAALCGSSPATAAAIGRISVNEMVDRGYDPGFSTGVIAAGGTLGIMIPPSMAFVVYGIITETSIAKLFIAGILPGLLISFLLCVFIVLRATFNPSLVGVEKAPKRTAERAVRETADSGKSASGEFWADLKTIVPPMVLIVLVLGTLYTGMATATEASGVGATGAFLIIILLGRLRLSTFFDICAGSARISVMIVFLIFAGLSLSYVVTFLGIAHGLANLIVGFGVNRWVFFILTWVLWLVLGCILDPTSMIVMTIPFLFPTFTALGFDPLWIGVVSTLSVEIGMITPPVGLNLFVIKAVTDVPIKTIISGTIPFIFILFAALMFLVLFPGLVSYLPSKM